MSFDRTIKEVTSVTIELLLREPFFGHFLTGLLKEVNPQVPTLGVRLAGPDAVQLSINPDFWDTQLTDKNHRYGVVKHEILHIALRHILMTDRFSHKQIFNIAADIVVNQYVEPDRLPEGAILLEQFRDFNMEPGKDVGYYYKRLLKEHRQDSAGGKGGSGSPSSQRLEELLDGDNEWLQRHDEWHRQIAKLSAAERSNLEQTVDSIIHTASERVGEREIGKLPGELKSYLKSIEEQHKPPWTGGARYAFLPAAATVLTSRIPSGGLSKRYGTTPGIKIRRKQRLLVAVDTSGSISDPEVQRFFSEVYQIWRHGAEIMVVECDTAIKRQYPYRGHAPDFVIGGGGTDFNPPLEFANRHFHPDGIVYFTDGYAAVPKVESRYPVMWLITPNGLQEHNGIWDQLPGRKVKMKS